MSEVSVKKQDLLTHYQNLRHLITQQLEALRSGRFDVLDALIPQKQLLIEHVERSLAELGGWESLGPEMKMPVRKLLLDCMAMEEECEQRLAKVKNALQREMAAVHRENTLQEKYGEFLATNQFFDQSK